MRDELKKREFFWQVRVYARIFGFFPEAIREWMQSIRGCREDTDLLGDLEISVETGTEAAPEDEL